MIIEEKLQSRIFEKKSSGPEIWEKVPFFIVFPILRKILSIIFSWNDLELWSMIVATFWWKPHVQEKSGSLEIGKSAKIGGFFKIDISSQRKVQIEISFDFQKDVR